MFKPASATIKLEERSSSPLAHVNQLNRSTEPIEMRNQELHQRLKDNQEQEELSTPRSTKPGRPPTRRKRRCRTGPRYWMDAEVPVRKAPTALSQFVQF